MSAAATRKQLNLFDATMLVMGGIIGVGIFFNPQSIAQLVPNPTAYFGMWIFGGIGALAGAMTFAELAATFPRSGGWFVFLQEAFGPASAFLFAWIVLFVVSTGASAVVADFSAAQFVALAWPNGDAPEGAHMLFGASILLGITLIGLSGIKRGAVLQNVVMLLKLSAFAIFVVSGLVFAAPSDPTPVVTQPVASGSLATGLIRASLPVLFSFGGWQLLTYIAPSVRDPQRTLPRAIVLGILGVITVYLSVNAAFVHVLGMSDLASLDNFTSEMARRSLGASGELFLTAAMAISSLGVCAAILITTPGVYVAMAQRGLFLKSFGREHPRTGAPVLALGVQGAVALAYFAWGRAGLLVDAAVFTEWIFHAQCGLALIALRKWRPELPRPYKSWAYPFFPVLYAVLAFGVVGGSLVLGDRDTTALGLSVLGAGLLVYVPWSHVCGLHRHPKSALAAILYLALMAVALALHESLGSSFQELLWGLVVFGLAAIVYLLGYSPLEQWSNAQKRRNAS